MADDLDDILRRVASGELTPEAALPLIDSARPAASPPSPDAAPGWGTPEAGGAPAGNGSDEPAAAAVRIAVSYRSVDVIADPSVAEVAVVGAHTVRRDGGVLVVESLALPGFGESGAGRDDTADRGERGGAFSFASLPRSLAWARAMKDQHLVIRVNPAMPIEVDAAATGLRIHGCEGGSRIRLVASSLKADRLRGWLDVDAVSSSVKGTVVVSGESRIACESASVKLALLPGSDVRLTATNRLGKVVLPGVVSKAGPSDGQAIEAVIGDGTGRLTIDAVMSSVVLTHEIGVHGMASA